MFIIVCVFIKVNLMQAYVANVEGVNNPKYGFTFLNFMLALSESGNKKAFEYISGNLCLVSLCHILMLTAKTKNNTIYWDDKRH